MKTYSRKIGKRAHSRPQGGFTIPELLIASLLLIIVCIGVLESYVQAIKINRGNNLRMQALSVLQQEVEFYRSLKFIPVGSSPEMTGGTYNNARTRTSADGQVFRISVVVDDIPGDITSPEPDISATSKFKQITITAVPQTPQREAWLQNLPTTVSLQRVRSN